MTLTYNARDIDCTFKIISIFSPINLFTDQKEIDFLQIQILQDN